MTVDAAVYLETLVTIYETWQCSSEERNHVAVRTRNLQRIEIPTKETEPPELNVEEETNYKCVYVQSQNPKGKRLCVAVVSKIFTNMQV
jgi:hypothetical protein